MESLSLSWKIQFAGVVQVTLNASFSVFTFQRTWSFFFLLRQNKNIMVLQSICWIILWHRFSKDRIRYAVCSSKSYLHHNRFGFTVLLIQSLLYCTDTKTLALFHFNFCCCWCISPPNAVLNVSTYIKTRISCITCIQRRDVGYALLQVLFHLFPCMQWTWWISFTIVCFLSGCPCTLQPEKVRCDPLLLVEIQELCDMRKQQTDMTDVIEDFTELDEDW